MSEAYIGEIRCFGFGFAPYQWALCNGQLMAISQNAALFSILGTSFGGNGTTTFGLPNLQGQIPMHWGSAPGLPTTVIGEVMGTPTVSLMQQQIPLHNHAATACVLGSVNEQTATPNANCFLADAETGDHPYLASPTVNAPFSPKAISTAGNSIPHDNMQPYLAMSFCISLYGIFPSRS